MARVTQRDSHKHLYLFTQPGAEFLIAKINVADPERLHPEFGGQQQVLSGCPDGLDIR